MRGIYRLQVHGHPPGLWTRWRAGWHVHPREDGTTVLCAPVIDQGTLHEVIQQIRDLGVPLISVLLVEEAPSEEKAAS